jgi:hypothetical protein
MTNGPELGCEHPARHTCTHFEEDDVMPLLPAPRKGKILKVKRRKVDFSFWPMSRSTRRYGLQSRVFATDPWAVIRHSIDKRCPGSAITQAQAFRAQAQDYFRAAQVADLFTTKPVLLYYSFLNLVKAYVLTVSGRSLYERTHHGLTKATAAGGQELFDSHLEAKHSRTNVNVFDDFLAALTGSGLSSNKTYRMTHLLPQLLQGHRLWCAASGNQERFVEVTRIDLLQDRTTKKLWIAVNIFEDDLDRLGISRHYLLQGSKLISNYREVRSDEELGGRHLLKFERKELTPYTHRPSDVVPDLVTTLKQKLWINVLSVPPYRKYYVHVAPPSERSFVLPQLASIFAFFFYLGSVTRYQPQRIDGLIRGSYGAQLEEAVINLPNQFLYLTASELSQQDVTRAAIV